MFNTAIGLIIALTAGGGVSFAAEGATPGEALYPVKTGVNESVMAWIATSNEAEAELHTRLAERRLNEAAELSTEGRLNNETRAEIQQRLTNHVSVAREKLQELENSQRADIAAEVSSRLESALKAHAQVLGRLETNGNISEDVRAQVRKLQNDVQAKANVAQNARADIEARITANGGSRTEEAARGKMTAAENRLEAATEALERIDVSGEVQADVQAKLDAAAKAIADGEAAIENEAYADAFAEFQTAMRHAHEAQVFASTSGRVRINIGDGAAVEAGGGASATSSQEQNGDASQDGADGSNDDDANGDNGSSVEGGVDVEAGGSVDTDAGSVDANAEGSGSGRVETF